MRNFIVIVSMLLSATALVYADSSIKMVTYFPIPYASYNRVDTNHRLDIGLSGQTTTLTLGAPDMPDVNPGLKVLDATNVNVHKLKINGLLLTLDSSGEGINFNKLATVENPTFEFKKFSQIDNFFGNSLNTGKLEQYKLTLFGKKFPAGMESTCRDTMSWERLRLGPNDTEDLYLTCGYGKGLMCTPGDHKTLSCGCNGSGTQEKTCLEDGRSYRLTKCTKDPCPYCYWSYRPSRRQYETTVSDGFRIPTGDTESTLGVGYWCHMDSCRYLRLTTQNTVYKEDVPESDWPYNYRPYIDPGIIGPRPRQAPVRPGTGDIAPMLPVLQTVPCEFNPAETCIENPLKNNLDPFKLASYAGNSECNDGVNVGSYNDCPEGKMENNGVVCNVSLPSAYGYTAASRCESITTKDSVNESYYWRVTKYQLHCSQPTASPEYIGHDEW